MKTYLIVLLAVTSTALAQQNPAPNATPLNPPPTPAGVGLPPRHNREPEDVVNSKSNYRIRLEIKEGKEAPMEISVVTADGRVKADIMNPKRLVIDEREVPSTVKFTGTLSVLSSDKCQFNLFLGRTIPYVTGTHKEPDGKTTSQYQQMQVGLETTVILEVGKPLVVQSDTIQQVKVTLEKMTK